MWLYGGVNYYLHASAISTSEKSNSQLAGPELDSIAQETRSNHKDQRCLRASATYAIGPEQPPSERSTDPMGAGPKVKLYLRQSLDFITDLHVHDLDHLLTSSATRDVYGL